jgi:hypothetical protein
MSSCGAVADDNQLVDLIAALDRAGSTVRPLQTPTMPALIDELDLWIEDEGQWREGRSKHWQSLLHDVERTVGEHGDALLRHAGQLPSRKLEIRDFSASAATTRAVPNRRSACGSAGSRIASGPA